jgi:uncharacterized integral membrane protein
MSAEHRKIVGWVLLGLLLFFILINLEKVPINFFFVADVKLPVAFVLFLSAAMGAGAVYAFQFIRKYKKDGAEPPK